MPLSSIAATAISEGAKFLFGQMNDELSLNRQKRLYDYQNDPSLVTQRMQAAGISPAAAAQGISGAAGGSMPTVNSSYTPSDIASNIRERENVQSQINQREIENQFQRMKMFWEPKKYQADITKAFADANLQGGLLSYYKELEKDVREKRPWQISTMYHGLQKMSAEIDELVARQKLYQHQGRYFDAAATNQYSQSFESNWKTENYMQDYIAKSWANDLRQSGFDPNASFWENMKREAAIHPENLQSFLNSAVTSLGKLDNQLKTSLGENYKRNAAIGIGLHYLNNRLGQHLNNKAYRTNLKTGALKNLISIIVPFLGGTSSGPIGPSYASPNYYQNASDLPLNYYPFSPSSLVSPLVPYGNFW